MWEFKEFRTDGNPLFSPIKINSFNSRQLLSCSRNGQILLKYSTRHTCFSNQKLGSGKGLFLGLTLFLLRIFEKCEKLGRAGTG